MSPATPRNPRTDYTSSSSAAVWPGLETMLALRAIAEERVDLELIAPEPHFRYRPLAVAEPFAAGRAHHFELVGVASACRARFTLGSLASVEPERHIVRTTSSAIVVDPAFRLATREEAASEPRSRAPVQGER